MKNLLFVFMATVLSANLNAHWSLYNHDIVILNDLNQEQLNLSLKKAQNTITTGGVFLLTGVASAIVGIILYNDPENLDNKKTGKYLIYAGSGLTTIGIPVLSIGNIKKKNIELKLLKFKGSASLDVFGAGLRIRF